MTSADPVVEFDHVTKLYDPSPRWLRLLSRQGVRSRVTALEDVSLAVNAGEIHVVLGPNGAGKSTMFRLVMGLTTATTGSLRVLGADPGRRRADVLGEIGYMPADDRSLFLRLSCRENLRMHAFAQGLTTDGLEERIDRTLASVGIGDVGDRLAFTLSSGMRSRLMLARALIHEPRLLVLDEPTGPVDPVGAAQLISLIESIAAERQIAVILSSHRLEDVSQLDDRVILLDTGRIRFSGTLAELRGRYSRTFVSATVDAVDAVGAVRGALGSLGDVNVEELTISLTTSASSQDVLTALRPHLDRTTDLHTRHADLREVLTAMPESS